MILQFSSRPFYEYKKVLALQTFHRSFNNAVVKWKAFFSVFFCTFLWSQPEGRQFLSPDNIGRLNKVISICCQLCTAHQTRQNLGRSWSFPAFLFFVHLHSCEELKNKMKNNNNKTSWLSALAHSTYSPQQISSFIGFSFSICYCIWSHSFHGLSDSSSR